MTLLEEKHLQILDDKLEAGEMPNCIIGKEDAAKECAKITLQHCIDVLKGVIPDSNLPSSEFYERRATMIDYLGLKVSELQQQLSDLNNNP